MGLDVQLQYEVEPNEFITVFDSNITHNLCNMAEHIGLYKPVWRPDENGLVYAKDLIEPLKLGINKMLNEESECIKFNSPNGYGSYSGMLNFLTGYLEACIKYPNSIVKVWR